MQLMDEQRSEHSVELLCELLAVDSSSYYRYQSDRTKPKDPAELAVAEAIRQSYEASGGIYGRPRIHEKLKQQGIGIGSTKLARLMKEQGIVGCYNEPAKPKTTDSRHGGRISANRLKEQGFPTAPRQVVVTDTTYVWSDEGWRYLATVMDLFTREILGWSFSKTNDAKLVCQALWNASADLKGYERVIHHSDRGSTYCCDNYLKLLKQLNLIPSMSAKGYCYDNAHMESFFGSLKCECKALKQSLRPKEIKLALFAYIEGFYNTHRIHTSLGGLSPKQYHLRAATPMGVINS